MSVLTCISMVFRSSSEWSRIPGVSTTCQVHKKLIFLGMRKMTFSWNLQISSGRGHTKIAGINLWSWCCSRANLPSEVFVVHMTNKQRLGCESIWLDLNICSCHLTEQNTFNIWLTICGSYINLGSSGLVMKLGGSEILFCKHFLLIQDTSWKKVSQFWKRSKC